MIEHAGSDPRSPVYREASTMALIKLNPRGASGLTVDLVLTEDRAGIPKGPLGKLYLNDDSRHAPNEDRQGFATWLCESAEHYFSGDYCRACHRQSEDCSADPCEAVIADREEGEREPDPDADGVNPTPADREGHEPECAKHDGGRCDCGLYQ